MAKAKSTPLQSWLKKQEPVVRPDLSNPEVLKYIHSLEDNILFQAELKTICAPSFITDDNEIFMYVYLCINRCIAKWVIDWQCVK